MTTRKYIGYRPTWAEVYLGNISYNFAQIQKMVSPGVKIMVTVKADAYGHGLIPVARQLVSCGIEYFGVASIDEGIVLRKTGIKQPILILGMILKDDINPIFEFGLTPTVCTLDLAMALAQEARRIGKHLKIHIKVDTGMGRIGVLPLDAHSLIRKIYTFKALEVEGVFTHFAFADMNRNFTEHQIRLFNELVRKLGKQGMKIPFVHSANSMGVISYKEAHFNMVRPGLVVYGISPKEGLKLDLKPALSLKTKVIYAKKTPKGHGISYGHTYVTNKKTNVVTLPIGYGDGYPRNLSNIAPVLIRGKRFKISGRVCMDQIMVDVGRSRVIVGDEVVLIGRQNNSHVTATELADLSGTIPYEIVCGIGSRVPRVYLSK